MWNCTGLGTHISTKEESYSISNFFNLAQEKWPGACWAPETSHQMCHRRSAVRCVSSMSQTQTTQCFTVNIVLSFVQKEEQMDIYSLWSFLHPVFSNYELSRASRTFMICCLMTLVASPALGIKYLSSGNKREHKKLRTASDLCFF